MSSSGISVMSLAKWSLVRKINVLRCAGFGDIRWVVNSVADLAGGPALPLFLDQSESRRAEKKNSETGPPPLI